MRSGRRSHLPLFSYAIYGSGRTSMSLKRTAPPGVCGTKPFSAKKCAARAFASGTLTWISLAPQFLSTLTACPSSCCPKHLPRYASSKERSRITPEFCVSPAPSTSCPTVLLRSFASRIESETTRFNRNPYEGSFRRAAEEKSFSHDFYQAVRVSGFFRAAGPEQKGCPRRELL